MYLVFLRRDGDFIQTPLNPPFDALQSYSLVFFLWCFVLRYSASFMKTLMNLLTSFPTKTHFSLNFFENGFKLVKSHCGCNGNSLGSFGSLQRTFGNICYVETESNLKYILWRKTNCSTAPIFQDIWIDRLVWIRMQYLKHTKSSRNGCLAFWMDKDY